MTDKATQPPRTYAVCWVCKRRSTDRSKFYVDPFAPIMGVAYRCPDHEACSERRRNREADAVERRQAKREAERAELADVEPEQCTAETATRYCVLDAGHDGQHVDGIATWSNQPAAEPSVSEAAEVEAIERLLDGDPWRFGCQPCRQVGHPISEPCLP
jgi:hypothetical protein